MKPVRQAAAAIREALTDLEPAPAVEITGQPARWHITGATRDDIRTIDAADLETVLNGYAS